MCLVDMKMLQWKKNIHNPIMKPIKTYNNYIVIINYNNYFTFNQVTLFS